MNETIKSLLQRRSIRNFRTDPVEKELIDIIVKTGEYAATTRNLQPLHFTVVTNQKILNDIVKAYKEELLKSNDPEEVERGKDENYHNFYLAPTVIFVSGEKDSKYKMIDGANSTQNMAVASYSLGLGSCYIMSFIPAFRGDHKEELLRKLNIPNGFEMMYSIAIGYTDELDIDPKPKKDTIVNYVS